MAHVRRRKPWDRDELLVSPEAAFASRRDFLKATAAIGAGLLFGGIGGAEDAPAAPSGPAGDRYPAKRNEAYKVDRELTDMKSAGTYNNFYEFSTDKAEVWQLAGKLKTEPWTLDCVGLVNKPKKWDVGDLVRGFDLEERTYRHRCVEAWSMAIPWTGISLKKLIESLDPQGKAKFVKFISFNRPEEAPGQGKDSRYHWPYYEGLTIEEATNELAFVVTGAYGKPLPKAHGAPIRIVVPWKYGYKSPKSIVSLELVEEKPKTFWSDANPREYPFESNVDPEVPHPRWSQAKERFIGPEGKVEQKDTQKYNGYGEYVAKMYEKDKK